MPERRYGSRLSSPADPVRAAEIWESGCNRLEFHEEKDEISFVLSGRAIVSQGESPDAPDRWEFGPGDTWRFSRVVYALEAVEGAEIIEVSAPQFDDVIRMEDRYGRVGDAAP
jgi:mannose-6-phosphate isomerase